MRATEASTNSETAAPARRPSTHRFDVAVVGAGPSGASCAFWLAEAGYDVVLLEKKIFPRAKTCGDGLTPRSVRQLQDMGLEPAVQAKGHLYRGLRAIANGRTMELGWPRHASLPDYGYVITRYDLDLLVAEHAAKAGADLRVGSEVTRVVGSPSGPEGVTVRDKVTGASYEIKSRFLVVADGANSRIGRQLGAVRDRSMPMGLAIRGYYTSDRHDEPWIESHLGITDSDGNALPGYGWIFPIGDGRVNVGVGLLSTSARWKSVNTTKLMEAFVANAPAAWGLSPRTALGPPTGGKLPMGLSVGPRFGSNYLLCGDAAGSINPFNGEGIAYGYETGRMAAVAIGRAMGGAELAGYEQSLCEAYEFYYRIARQFVGIIGQPRLMAALVGAGMTSPPLMSVVLRIMANLLRSDEVGPAEFTYRAAAMLARLEGGSLSRRLRRVKDGDQQPAHRLRLLAASQAAALATASAVSSRSAGR
jgi:geranylgeranyl reductase family protein